MIKNVEVKGGKEKLTNKEKFPTILTCNQIIFLTKQWQWNTITVAAHLGALALSKTKDFFQKGLNK